jgi:UDP-N-acetyl-D-galactosamine dehydrogenase
MLKTDRKIALIGLGYVGFPLFKDLSDKYSCWGLDSDSIKIAHLKKECPHLKITSNLMDVRDCDFYVVAVPTPIDNNNSPDVTPLKNVCRDLANVISRGDIIVFESTVYPGATEELCIPILETLSGLKINKDFYVGYSPERINVGDKIHQLHNTPKIVSATNDKICDLIKGVYESILSAEVHKASSIKVAEAAKMYENVQRDVLIALANQYSDYCRGEGIDVYEVTKCASTKWNFSNVKPGLVGGHCIGVDPYYLLERASSKGIPMPLVEMARQINETKSGQVAQRILDMGKSICGPQRIPNILLLGFSYKPNTNDIRNTKVADVVKRLQGKCNLDCYDPLADSQLVRLTYGVSLCPLERIMDRHYDLSVEMVPHEVLSNLDIESTVHIDIKDLL